MPKFDGWTEQQVRDYYVGVEKRLTTEIEREQATITKLWEGPSRDAASGLKDATPHRIWNHGDDIASLAQRLIDHAMMLGACVEVIAAMRIECEAAIAVAKAQQAQQTPRLLVTTPNRGTLARVDQEGVEHGD